MALIEVIFDQYSSQVESQLTRDIIALKNEYPREQFIVKCVSSQPRDLLNAFNVDLVHDGEPALYVVYKTTEFWPDHPTEGSVIFRDLYVSDLDQKLDGEQHIGYYKVPERQGRPIAPQFRRRMPPMGKGAIDPALLLLWGGPGLD